MKITKVKTSKRSWTWKPLHQFQPEYPIYMYYRVTVLPGQPVQPRAAPGNEPVPPGVEGQPTRPPHWVTSAIRSRRTHRLTSPLTVLPPSHQLYPSLSHSRYTRRYLPLLPATAPEVPQPGNSDVHPGPQKATRPSDYPPLPQRVIKSQRPSSSSNPITGRR